MILKRRDCQLLLVLFLFYSLSTHAYRTAGRRKSTHVEDQTKKTAKSVVEIDYVTFKNASVKSIDGLINLSQWLSLDLASMSNNLWIKCPPEKKIHL